MSFFNAALHAGCPATILTLPKNTAAIQISADSGGKIRLGTLLQLPGGATVEVIGEGFDEHTARVLWEGSSYYIFLDADLAARPIRAKAHSAG